MLTKSVGFNSDNVTYDLEDSVTPSMKPTARDQLKSHMSGISSRPKGIGEFAVRINAVSTPFALQDLSSLGSVSAVDAVVVPKVESAADLSFVTDVLRHVAPERHEKDSKNPIKIIALIESAKAIMDLGSICRASPYLSGLIFAAEDFALDLSITRTPSLTEFLYARSAIVTAARAAELPSAIDLVCTSFKGEEGIKRLEEECRGGNAMGFNGKQCIHPIQVETVQRFYAPSKEEVEWAVRISIADEKAAKSGRGAWTLNGKMIDAPVVGKAHAVVAKAERCGFDVQELKSKWQDQEPE
ncbi:Citrate lyase subunit beta-like protein [Emericellopsis cladophorae]|uniref:Citrate lyase subunit beta-like protein n=1 Tax=Emericellopsis cladophorae TaxID=2686198 RepID=A0A9P9XZY2_9HYPO|nr:Citrate lyase subunit beta-like protein [Emericellopsis cladophorae]KAI6781033.1 Citrate lyase subunit beta-like protein [Emericellopsis cladophorae]